MALNSIENIATVKQGVISSNRQATARILPCSGSLNPIMLDQSVLKPGSVKTARAVPEPSKTDSGGSQQALTAKRIESASRGLDGDVDKCPASYHKTLHNQEIESTLQKDPAATLQ